MVHANEFVVWCTSCIPLNSNNTLTVLESSTMAHNTYTSMASVAILVGFILCFFGYSIFRVTLFWIGFTMGGSLLFFLVCGATDKISAAIIACFIGGVVCAAVTVKVERVGFICCGAGGGLMLALYFNAFFLNLLYKELPGTESEAYAPYAMDFCFMVCGAVLACFFEKELIIASTALSGAYFLGWGCLCLLSEVTHTVDSPKFSPLALFMEGGCSNFECYALMAACVAVGLLGAVVQVKRTSQHTNCFSRKSDHKLKVVDSEGHAFLLVADD